MAMKKCEECGNEVSSKADACQKCGAKVKKTSVAAQVIGVIIALFVVAAIFVEGDGSTGAATANSATPATSSFETTAREIAAAYSENTVAADGKFKGQRFTIKGTISDINTDFTGSPVIILVGGVNEFMEPRAELVESELQKAASLKKGQAITLTCTGTGDITKTPMMDDCVIL